MFSEHSHQESWLFNSVDDLTLMNSQTMTWLVMMTSRLRHAHEAPEHKTNNETAIDNTYGV